MSLEDVTKQLVSSDDESYPKPKRLKLQTPLEIIMDGLRHNSCKEMSLGNSENKGRTVHAREHISKGDFVAEYKYSEFYPRKKRAEMEEEYKINGEGCFIMDVQLPGGKWVCIDATRNYSCWARYINHASPANANIKMFKPLLVRGKWRVGFIATRDIHEGEELLYDYGAQPNPPDWMKRRQPRVECPLKEQLVSSSIAAKDSTLSVKASPTTAIRIDGESGRNIVEEDSTLSVRASPTTAIRIDGESGRNIVEEDSTLSVRASPTTAIRIDGESGRKFVEEDSTLSVRASPTTAIRIYGKSGYNIVAEDSTLSVRASPTTAIRIDGESGRKFVDVDSTLSVRASPTTAIRIDGEGTSSSDEQEVLDQQEVWTTSSSSSSEDDVPVKTVLDPRDVWTYSESEDEIVPATLLTKSQVIISSDEEFIRPKKPSCKMVDYSDSSDSSGDEGHFPLDNSSDEDHTESNIESGSTSPTYSASITRTHSFALSSDEDDSDEDDEDSEVKRTPIQCTSSTSVTIKKSVKYNREKYRKRKICPVPGCSSKPQLKLSNHFTQYHADIEPSQRARLLKSAKVAPRTYIPQVARQSHLKFDDCQQQDQSTSTTTSTTTTTITTLPTPPILRRGATTAFGRFPSDHAEIKQFKQYLMSLDGKMRNEHTAEAITRDISKFVYFCSSESVQWQCVVDRSSLLRYMKVLSDTGVGPDGQLTKLERICDCIEYLEKRKMIDKGEIGEIRGDLRQWKRTLRVGKNRKNVERLEKVSDMKLSLEEITHVVDDDNMWAKFDKTIRKLRHGVTVSDDDLKLAMCSLMVTIKLKSMQRPGAVCNCTIEEFRAATVSDEVTVVKVKEHKTGKYGSAKLTMDGELSTRLNKYYKFVRPHLVQPGCDVPFLFILPGSRQVKKFGNIELYLHNHLGLKIPTSTRARKIGATCAARALGDQGNTLICNQMSHQPSVSSKYYKALKGAEDAATALHLMEGLRAKESQKKCSPDLSTASPTEITKKWSQHETERVKKKFSSEITEKKTPSLRECGFIATKSAKQIQDKVRTIIRQQSKI